MDFKKMREYTHEEFVDLVLSLNEEQLLELSAKYGGYPVLFRMALDDRISHIPFIQTGAAIIIRNENGQILLQERTDRNKWGLPGGCQDLGEDLKTTAVRETYEETGIKLDSNEINKCYYLFKPKLSIIALSCINSDYTLVNDKKLYRTFERNFIFL